MLCLSCGAGMSKQVVGDVAVDSCPSCAGTWFDGGEIVEAYGLGWIDRGLRGKASAGRAGGRACPRDRGSLGLLYVEGIEVDVCPGCHGVWLDAGELDRMVATDSRIRASAGQRQPGPIRSNATRLDRRASFLELLRGTRSRRR